MRIAFYAPLKTPDHPTPSGDRQMARLLMQTLAAAGHEVALASRFRSFDGQGEAGRQTAIRAAAAAESARLEQVYAGENPPQLWFTYHVYHKAPDWLGPALSKHLAIPYVIAEPSFAPKREGGAWDIGHRAAGAAIAAADSVFCLTRLDMACVEPLVARPHRLIYLPPFLDAGPFAAQVRDRAALAARFGLPENRKWLLVVAMMRAGDKLASYRELGAALAALGGGDWQLLVVGAGEAESEVRQALAGAGGRVSYAGALAGAELRRVYAACDLYLWPGVGEAYGMAYLEAQAAGLPVLACRRRGVPDVVVDGVGGLLTAPGDTAAFARAARRLLDDDGLRAELGRGARRFALTERSLGAAAALIEEGLP